MAKLITCGTPLIVAARLNDYDTCELLLTAGADVNRPADGDGNPLIAAAGNGNVELLQLFIDNGAAVNSIVEGDETPLINAARGGYIDAVRFLITQGADVNLAVNAPTISGTEWRSPLNQAQKQGHTDIVNLLHENGAHS